MSSKIIIDYKGDTQPLTWSEEVKRATDINTCLVIGPGFYGYGKSIKIAKQNCINAGCKRTAQMKAYFGDDSLCVTDFGEVKANKVLICLGEV